MKRTSVVACLSFAAGGILLSTPAFAQTIYKQVDAQGRVTYSSEPLKKKAVRVTRLEAPEAPSAEAIAAARRQVMKDRELVTQLEQDRLVRITKDEARREEALAQQRAARTAMAQQLGEVDDGFIVYPGWNFPVPIRPLLPYPRP